MDNFSYRKLILLGLVLGFLRIIVGVAVASYNFDVGYFFDVFIFAYLYLWPLLAKHLFSFKHIVLMNIFIAGLAIITHDLFLLYKNHSNLNLFLMNRSIVALYIFAISFLASVFCFFTQRFLLNRRK